MDDNRIVFFVGLGTAALISLLLFAFFLGSKPAKRPTKSSSVSPVAQKEAPGPKKIGKAYGTGPLPVTGSGISPAVAAEMTRSREILLKSQEEMEKIGAAWLEKYLNDPNVATLTREMYRARNDPNIQNGYALIFQGKYSQAKEEFLKAYTNPDASPVIKFTCLNFLLSIALQEKNHAEYFRLEIEKGELLANEDLSCMKQKKSDFHLTVMKEKQMYYNARNSPSLQKAAVESLLTRLGGTPTKQDREWAEREVKKQVAEITEEFGQ